MICFLEVGKRFGRKGVEALRGVSLTFSGGERVAIVGPNGAGKSTLLALALGFLRPTSGSITIEGGDPRAFLRRNGAGWVPERFHLPASWKVRTAVEHFARLAGSTPAAVAPALGHFGLDAHSGMPFGELSHGLARRLALAIATLTPGRLMVFDEPTEGLDPEGRHRFEARCDWLKRHGSTLLMASQDASAVSRIADRVIQLDRGTVAGDATRPSDPDGTAYQLVLDQPFERIAEFFPDATAGPGRNVFRVGVADPADLNTRIRSLIGAGGVVVSVQPAGPEVSAGGDRIEDSDAGADA